MPHTLHIIHGSHPCVCAERALQLKGQPYRLVELPPAAHVPVQWLRFRATTVPVLVLGSGEEIVGSRAIIHRLDELVPDPPLLPADAERRAQVEAAEQWGDEVLQSNTRALFWSGVRKRPDAAASYQEGSKLPVPRSVGKLITPGIARLAGWRNKASEARARKDLAALPAQLDRIDAWISDGVLGGEQPNAADLQIGSSLRMLASFGDVRPWMEGRPSLALAMRVVPTYAGYMPPGALPV